MGWATEAKEKELKYVCNEGEVCAGVGELQLKGEGWEMCRTEGHMGARP